MPAFSKPFKLADICANLAQQGPNPLTYETLCRWVEGIEWTNSDWINHVPVVHSDDDYARNILCLEPFEVVLLHWPAGVESAVHHHEGFWGTVVCLQGVLENVTYELSSGVLREKDVLRALPRGIVPEPDGTIHKIRNGSEHQALVTLHFYHPALEDLDGLVLYDLAAGSAFTCNETAPTASIHLPDSNYRSIGQHAFRFEPLPEASHVQCNVVPKPDAETIEHMIEGYFAEHANQYDALDAQIQKRRRYTSAIDRMVASGLRILADSHPVERVMHLACGTGRRAVDIQAESGLAYSMEGVDMCEEMVAHAAEREVKVHVASLRHPEEFMQEDTYDAVTLLYAFGHLPDRDTRQKVIGASFEMLKPGGVFYFDAFDAKDENEWGPAAMQQFREQRLGPQGYEEGDVFYRRTRGEHVAFLHYCSSARLRSMMEEAGFVKIEMTTIGYDRAVGVESEDGKLFISGRKPNQ
jgi:ubiquinone/menaquinone biosynthesis C-methylase UbiE/predicted metal-dependent enzyme (double-stranded beta helix superfamily)